MKKFYCSECNALKGNVKGNGEQNYCQKCGCELIIKTKEEIRKESKEKIDWPKKVTISVPIRMQGDYSYEIKSSLETSVLPFSEAGDEYFIDRNLGNAKVDMVFKSDGTYEIKNISIE